MDGVSDLAPSPFPARTLAVADDDEVHAELVSAWLEHHGFRVLRFGSGDALLEWASSSGGTVDAVVLDVEMPGRDGFQSCRALRALPAYASVPAVFVSSASPDRVPPDVAGEDRVQFIRKDGEMLVRLSRWLDDHMVPAA
jgi:CheY-like chemotaxis protein